MAELVNAYASPSRNFDEATAIEVKNLVDRKVRALADMDAIVAAVDTAMAALGEEPVMSVAGTSSRNLVLEGEGTAHIERICSGHGVPAPPVNKEANGYLDLTVGYTQEGLDPVVFGGATNCHEQVGAAELSIEGAINLYIGESLTIDKLGTSPILFQLDGFALDSGTTRVVDGGFDFQVCRGTESNCVENNFEVLLGLSTGTLVFFVDLGTKTGGFRGANGRWSCDFAASRCTNTAGDVVMTPMYDL